MRKLIQALLLTLALTASIYAGDMQQPIAPTDPATAQGETPNNVTASPQPTVGEVLLTLLQVLIA